MNGYGRTAHDDGEFYEGELKNHQNHGIGKYVFDDGEIQEGLFVKGVFEDRLTERDDEN